MIQFTAEKYQSERECSSGMSSVITWVFRKLMRCSLYLMTAAWLCAAIYSITKQATALNLMLITLLITVIILLTGLVLLAVLLIIASVSKLSRKQPERPKERTAEILYMMPRKEP